MFGLTIKRKQQQQLRPRQYHRLLPGEKQASNKSLVPQYLILDEEKPSDGILADWLESSQEKASQTQGGSCA